MTAISCASTSVDTMYPDWGNVAEFTADGNRYAQTAAHDKEIFPSGTCIWSTEHSTDLHQRLAPRAERYLILDSAPTFGRKHFFIINLGSYFKKYGSEAAQEGGDVNLEFLTMALQSALANTQPDELEHGYESELTHTIEAMVDEFGETSVMEQLNDLLDEPMLSEDLVGYIIRWIGACDFGRGKIARDIFEKFLNSEASYLRDCAAIAIGLSDSKNLLPQLKEAHEQETSSITKAYIADLISRFGK